MADEPSYRADASRAASAEACAFPDIGTDIATRANACACVLSYGLIPAPAAWGGARNRADRASFHLSRRQCEDMIAAARFAEHAGHAFQRHWTIHYESAGIPDSEGAAFVGRLLHTVKRHARRAGGDVAAIWARENGPGKRGHVHIALSLPAGFTLRNRTRRWIEAAGGKCQKGTSKIRIIGGTLPSASRDGERHRDNVGAVMGYLMKGADKAAGEALGLDRYGEAGRIIGKRCGWTQNIGKAERARACASLK